MKIEYYIIGVSGSLILAILAMILSQPYTTPSFESSYDKDELFEMHDLIVDVSRSAELDFPDGPAVMFVVNEFYKNPKNASHLIVKGDFEQNSEFCQNPRNDNKCSRLLVYLYEDKNGIYYQGEYFAFITEECDAKCHLGLK